MKQSNEERGKIPVLHDLWENGVLMYERSPRLMSPQEAQDMSDQTAGQVWLPACPDNKKTKIHRLHGPRGVPSGGTVKAPLTKRQAEFYNAGLASSGFSWAWEIPEKEA